MNRIIKIVHLEDDGNDAILVKKAIESEISSCVIKRVTNKDEFVKAIDNNQCDLIISDFALPTFDGIEALKIARKLAPNVPYIYVSGHIGEDRAIEALKNGATDYVLKDKPSKLVPAIIRALKEVKEKEERRILEKAVRASERFAKSTLDAMTVPVAVLDDKGVILVINKAWKKNLYNEASVPQGLKEGENYIEKCLEGAVAESDASKFARGLLSVFNESAKTYSQDYSFYSAGEKKWFRSIVEKFEEAGPVRLVILHIDITETKLATEKLKDSEKRYRLLAENSSDMISSHDADWKFLYVSPACRQLLGYNPGELIGTKIFEIIDQDDWEEISQIGNTVFEEGKAHSVISRTRKKDGSYVWIEMTAKRILNDATGDVESIVAISRDISDRKNYEFELKTAKEKAEELNKLKTSFLANMSHELRTPLIGIMGYAEILKSQPINSEYREMAETIFNSGYRLLETLNLILDLSRIESNKTYLKYKLIDCVAKIKLIVKLFSKVAEKKNLYLEFDSEIDFLEIETDERMFTAIIENLINNALKFTDEGGVTVNISVIEKDENPWVKIKVTDTGIGIPEESQAIIFEEFRQVSEGYGRGFEGTGLGLTISRKFVEKLNGTITLESHPETGTTFIVSLPVNKVIEENIVQREMESVRENLKPNKSDENENGIEVSLPSVLLVEDDTTTSSVTDMILNKIYDLDITNNGLKAIQMAKTKKYSAILMDINLGYGINGLETTKQIKALPGYDNVSIIAFTAFAMENDKSEFLAAGCTHYISKPFAKKELLEVVKAATDSSIHLEIKSY